MKVIPAAVLLALASLACTLLESGEGALRMAADTWSRLSPALLTQDSGLRIQGDTPLGIASLPSRAQGAVRKAQEAQAAGKASAPLLDSVDPPDYLAENTDIEGDSVAEMNSQPSSEPPEPPTGAGSNAEAGKSPGNPAGNTGIEDDEGGESISGLTRGDGSSNDGVSLSPANADETPDKGETSSPAAPEGSTGEPPSGPGSVAGRGDSPDPPIPAVVPPLQEPRGGGRLAPKGTLSCLAPMDRSYGQLYLRFSRNYRRSL